MSKEEIAERAGLTLDAWEQGEPIDEISFADDIRNLIAFAIANKATEEGELISALKKIAAIEDKAFGGDWDEIEEAREIARQAIASDRASRQVANKAEVEPIGYVVDIDRNTNESIINVALEPGTSIYATPPATTGASTAGLEPILDRLENAIGGYSGGPFDKVQAIIDELRALPDCGACPGDGSMCKSRCKVEEESPASTVLTDEPGPLNTLIQIAEFLDSSSNQKQTGVDSWDYASQFDYELGHAASEIRSIVADISSQVAAQAGQVAVPEDLLPPLGIHSDRDMLKYLMTAFDNEIANCERCGHAEPTKNMDSASFLRDYLAAAPSPAKESK